MLVKNKNHILSSRYASQIHMCICVNMWNTCRHNTLILILYICQLINYYLKLNEKLKFKYLICPSRRQMCMSECTKTVKNTSNLIYIFFYQYNIISSLKQYHFLHVRKKGFCFLFYKYILNNMTQRFLNAREQGMYGTIHSFVLEISTLTQLIGG